MPFKVEYSSDHFIEKSFKRAMKELDDFFEINWKRNTPKIFLLKDRKTIEELRGKNSPSWVVGWINNVDIYILDRESYEKESPHKYSDEEYLKLIKHELVHSFTQVYLKNVGKPLHPIWLWEGLAVYLSGQLSSKKPKKLESFLEFYSKGGPAVYDEAGFAVKYLVEKSGKQKLLDLLKAAKSTSSQEEFNKKFQEIYNFPPTYENFKI